MTAPGRLGPVLASSAAAGGLAAWLLVFVEESRCERDDLVWLTVLALVLTTVPTVGALLTRASWWVGVACTGVLLLALLGVFAPGDVYGCGSRIIG